MADRSSVIGIIDCGISNIGSISQSVARLGFSAKVLSEPDQVQGVTHLILPGQGSFFEAAERLRSLGWDRKLKRAVLEEKKYILGICLGMQLFATVGTEGCKAAGLNLIEAEVVRFSHQGLRVPHVGWNSVFQKRDCPIFRSVNSPTDFYFSHSFVLLCESTKFVSSTCNYGQEFVSSISCDNVFGTQFHPEKSSKAGRQVLKNFCEL